MAFYNIDETNVRIGKIRELLQKKKLDAVLIYYDMVNIANGWYLTGWCPQFEYGAVLVPLQGEPLLLGGSESEEFAKQDSAIKNTRNFSVFMQPGIEFLYSRMYDFEELNRELAEAGTTLKKIGFVAPDKMPTKLYRDFCAGFEGIEIVDITFDFELLRLVKSSWELSCMEKANTLADAAYDAMIKVIKPGVSELQVAAAGEYAARWNGASGYGFDTIIASGRRVEGIVSTPVDKTLQAGEMIMLGMAPQWCGYTGTFGDTVPVSGEYTVKQRDMMNAMRHALQLCKEKLYPGVKPVDIDKAGMDYLRKLGYGDYLVAQFAHSTGLMECEGASYTSYDCCDGGMPLEPGMTIMIDVSMFKIPEVIGGRIETGYRITENGPVALSPETDRLFATEIK